MKKDNISKIKTKGKNYQRKTDSNENLNLKNCYCINEVKSPGE